MHIIILLELCFHMKPECQNSAVREAPGSHHLTELPARQRIRTQKVEAMLGALLCIRSASNLSIKALQTGPPGCEAVSDYLHCSPASRRK
jgi:hypothetical protein